MKNIWLQRSNSKTSILRIYKNAIIRFSEEITIETQNSCQIIATFERMSSKKWIEFIGIVNDISKGGYYGEFVVFKLNSEYKRISMSNIKRIEAKNLTIKIDFI